MIPGPYVVGRGIPGAACSRGRFACVIPARETAGVVLVDCDDLPVPDPGKPSRRLPSEGDPARAFDLAAAVAESAGDHERSGDLPLVVLGPNKPALDAKLLQAQDAEGGAVHRQCGRHRATQHALHPAPGAGFGQPKPGRSLRWKQSSSPSGRTRGCRRAVASSRRRLPAAASGQGTSRSAAPAFGHDA